jgi:hypothetical protein
MRRVRPAHRLTRQAECVDSCGVARPALALRGVVRPGWRGTASVVVQV